MPHYALKNFVFNSFKIQNHLQISVTDGARKQTKAGANKSSNGKCCTFTSLQVEKKQNLLNFEIIRRLPTSRG